MSKNNSFRWRNNPAVIAKYWKADALPKNAEVTLKPNEACVVIEDGKLVGVASQTRFTLDPKVGTLAKMFGKQQTDRSYMFVLLGPHDILLRADGTTKDGVVVNRVLGMKIEIKREQSSKLLQLPSKGVTEISPGNIVAKLENEVQSKVTRKIIAQYNHEELTTLSDAQHDFQSELLVSVKNTLNSLGIAVLSTWTNWNPAQHEKIAEMERNLEMFKEENRIFSEKENEEFEAILSAKKRRLELEHQLSLAETSVNAKAEIAQELARLEAKQELETKQWELLSARQVREATHNANMQSLTHASEIKDSQHALEMARSKIEEQRLRNMANLDTKDSQLDRDRTNRIKDLEVRQFERDMDFNNEMAKQKLELSTDEARSALKMNELSAMNDMTSEEEKRRLEAIQHGSDKYVEAVSDLANSEDADVRMKGLEMLAELRRSDVEERKSAFESDTKKNSTD